MEEKGAGKDCESEGCWKGKEESQLHKPVQLRALRTVSYLFWGCLVVTECPVAQVHSLRLIGGLSKDWCAFHQQQA
eukprot:scaffold311879_cov15-Tisochrysis_lutea.AAC.1